MRDDPRDGPQDDAADHVGPEYLRQKVAEVVPVHLGRAEQGAEVVPQLSGGLREFVEDELGRQLALLAQDLAAQLDRHQRDEGQGHRIAHEGRQQRGQHVAADDPGHRRRRQEVEPEQRREIHHDPRRDPARNAMRLVGQAAQPVGHIGAGPPPAARRIDHLAGQLAVAARFAAFEQGEPDP